MDIGRWTIVAQWSLRLGPDTFCTQPAPDISLNSRSHPLTGLSTQMHCRLDVTELHPKENLRLKMMLIMDIFEIMTVKYPFF